MRKLAVLIAAVATAAALSGAPGAASADVNLPPPCTDTADEAVTFTLSVNGEPATGRYAVPATAPKGLVVFAHGYGHTSASWSEHVRRTAADLGVITVAMDYRGIQVTPSPDPSQPPSSRGWNVTKGAEDSIAAAQWFESNCALAGPIVIFGVSMGGNTSGLVAAARAKRGDASTPLFDYWFDIEGATNVSELYMSARAIAPGNAYAAQAVTDIEQEMGGPIEARPGTYLEKSIVTRADDIAAAGIKGVVIVHGVEDGLVSHDQSRQMGAALQAAGVPWDFFTAVRRGSGEAGTTISGYAGLQSEFAGHASERSTTHVVMRTAFDRLAALYLAADAPACWSEYVVDGDAPAVPVYAC